MEIWEKIPQFNNEYEISSVGRIRSVEAEIIRSNGWKYTRKSKILNPDTKFSGYSCGAVCVNKKMTSYKVHRLVAIVFIPNPKNKPYVNHKNGIKSDNRIENLEWVTPKENVHHAHKNGLTNILKGSEIGNSILKEHQVIEIRKKFIPRKYTRKMLASEYGITVATIKDILIGRTWKHLL